jgi:hypothetical protein
MTYEQGGISAGLGVKTRVNDTLTLVDRTLHHYTTSMSTIETSAKNAARLISEYKKFFEDARNAVNMEYKTYVLTTNNAAQLQAVATLLDENKIQYGTTSNKTFKGYNYFSEKEELYSDEGYQLAVSAYQPKGKLLKVLFEPKSNLTDSNTYDITAWSIPFSYGIKAYAVKDKLNITAFNTLPTITPVSSNYGLLIPYNSLSIAQVLAYLLQHNVKVRFPQKPFTYNNKVYERGTLMVLKGNNVAAWNSLTNEACALYHIQADEVESGFVEKGSDFGSVDVRFIKAPNVAMLTGTEVSSSAAGEVWSFFDQTLHYPLTQLMAEDIEDIDLDKYDVLIVPDGYYSSLKEKDAGDKLESFVHMGGKIIAMENGCNALANWSWSGIKPKDNDDNDSSSKADYSLLKNYGDEMNDYITRTVPGAIYKLDLDNTHPLGYGYPKFYYTLKQDTNLFNFMKDGWNVGTIKTSNYTSGFAGSKVKPKLKDGTLIGESEYGRGSIVFFADDPLFRLFWQNGKLIFSSAIFLAGQ